MRLFSPSTRDAAHLERSVDAVRICVDGVFDSVLQGRIFTPDSRNAPCVIIRDGDVPLGDATVQPALAPPGESLPQGSETWTFTFLLPPSLNDGELHTFIAEMSGTTATFAFIGDPLLALHPRVRKRIIEQVAGSSLGVSPSRGLEPEGGDSEGVLQVLTAMSAAIAAQAQALQHLQEPVAPRLLPSVPTPPLTMAERYGTLYSEALLRLSTGRDYIWLGVIDWNFRTQRPQHLAANLADAGNRIFYVSLSFQAADESGRFQIVSDPHPGVFEIRLRLGGVCPQNIYAGFDMEQTTEIRKSLDEMTEALNIQAPVVVVEYPGWYAIATAVPGALVVHDCLDYVAGFSNVPPEMVALEEMLIENADLVITASQPLADIVGKHRAAKVVRNAADVNFFAQAAKSDTHRRKRRPVIGYFGAIAEWFEIDWIEACARERPDLDFVLIGAYDGCPIAAASDLPNVYFLGEQPYSTLPEHLANFDVATIPFKINDLIRCTNPVKLYEYMSAGTPVVASAMPEVKNATDLAYIATSAEDFTRQVTRALQEDGPRLRQARQEWAATHTWASRAALFGEAVDESTPKVSVIVLSYNNWPFTKACIRSILTQSDYPNLEVIVVDNGSGTEAVEGLKALEQREDPKLRIIFNRANLGFAAGNNVGLEAATGDVLIILNNDTYVTRGWVRDVIRPLLVDQEIGLVGPLTNNIGNEQKVHIHYSNMREMAIAARALARRYLRRRFPTENLAFFCVALRRDVLEKVGTLDEEFGLGFFEDDDYCRRVRKAGFKIRVVDDVFVHHHLSASFNALGADQKRAQMERNREIFERKWGEWTPHTYRDEPGFG